MHILPHLAAAEISSDLSRVLLIIATRLGCPVAFTRWERDDHGLMVPVLRVPAEFVADARELGLRVEVD